MTPASGNDLPFYNGQPCQIAWHGWLVILAATVCGFLALVMSPSFLQSGPMAIGPAFIFAVLPLAALAWVSGGMWIALFRQYTLKAFVQSVLFALLTLAAAVSVGLAIQNRVPMAENPVGGLLVSLQHQEIAWFLLRTFIQLIGEEVVTILPLLAILWVSSTRLHIPYRLSLMISVAVSTIWFSFMHLPTYNWNVIQCFGVIGISRLILTTAYLCTRNLWVSAGAHIANDWSMFALTYAGGHLPVAV